MTHTEVYWIVGTITFASTFGVYALVRKIQQHTPDTGNRLVRRRHDIELTDYIEPSRPEQIYNYPDLLGSYHPIYDRVSDSVRVPSYWTGNPPPSYQSGTIPSYQTVDRLNINSPLENSINLDYILIVFILVLFLILIWKLRITRVQFLQGVHQLFNVNKLKRGL
jgi:hypothetical protein